MNWLVPIFLSDPVLYSITCSLRFNISLLFLGGILQINLTFQSSPQTVLFPWNALALFIPKLTPSYH